MAKYRDYLFAVKEGECEGEEFAVEIKSCGDDVADMLAAQALAEENFPDNWEFLEEVDPYLVECYGIDTY